MDPIRVLHIVTSMNRGGTENVLMNYYRQLDRNKIQFDFLLSEPNHCAFEDEIIKLGGKVYRVPRMSELHLSRYIKAVNSFFKEHAEYKIVHSHISSKSTIPLWLAKHNNIPYRISHSHVDFSKHSSGQGVLVDIEKSILKIPLKRIATHYFACSKDAGIWLFGKKAMQQNKVKILYNAIDAKKFNYKTEVRKIIRSQLGISDNTCVIGNIARFSYPKNHRFAVDVLLFFQKQIPDICFLFVGDGELRTEIEHYAKELGVADRCRFIGVVPNVYDYVQAMDLFIFPSFYEGLGMGIIEAQASGLKCFASTGVPVESKVTDLVEFLPLSIGAEKWAEEISKKRDYERRGRYEEIKKAGYDATTTVKELQDFYLDLSK